MRRVKKKKGIWTGRDILEGRDSQGAGGQGIQIGAR